MEQNTTFPRPQERPRQGRPLRSDAGQPRRTRAEAEYARVAGIESASLARDAYGSKRCSRPLRLLQLRNDHRATLPSAEIIAASAAIVGGIAGGSIPGYFMLKVENKRHAHAREMANQARDDDRERERRAVIGTARALHEWFGRVDLMLGVSLQTERWWSNEIDVTLQPPSFDDQKAVLGHLPSYEAGVVATSMRAIELLLNTTPGMVARNSAGPEPRSLDETALAQFKSGQTAAQDGALALRSVAELPTPAKPES